MPKIKLTKTAVQAIEPPEPGSRLTVYDTQIPKLAVRVTAAGNKTFYVVKRAGSAAGSKMAWLKLGGFPDLTVEQARNEAQKVLAEFAAGANPAEARRAFREEPTFTELFDEYGRRHGEKKLSWRDDQQRFRDYLQEPLGNRKVRTITRAMIARVLSNAEKTGKATATVRQIRALASSVFSKAIEWGALDTNPAQGIKISGRSVSRDRFLQADEMPRFFASLAEEASECARDFILLALLTGARRANLLAMRWEEVNLTAGVWRIPTTKNGEPQNVTLAPEAITILKTRREASGVGFVFPSCSASGHFAAPHLAMERVLRRAGIPYGRNEPNGVTLHDLRRTLGSWQARTGASLAIIGKSLNHKSQQATAIYARLDLDPVRASVNTATSAMLEAAGLKNTADVMELPKRGAV